MLSACSSDATIGDWISNEPPASVLENKKGVDIRAVDQQDPEWPNIGTVPPRPRETPSARRDMLIQQLERQKNDAEEIRRNYEQSRSQPAEN
jgi:hypothetical protein